MGPSAVLVPTVASYQSAEAPLEVVALEVVALEGPA